MKDIVVLVYPVSPQAFTISLLDSTITFRLLVFGAFSFSAIVTGKYKALPNTGKGKLHIFIVAQASNVIL